MKHLQERTANASVLKYSNDPKQRAIGLIDYYSNGASIENVTELIDRKNPKIRSASDLAEQAMGVLRQKAYTPINMQVVNNSVYLMMERGKDHFIPLLASKLNTPVLIKKTPKSKNSNSYKIQLDYDPFIHESANFDADGAITSDLLDQLMYKLEKVSISMSPDRVLKVVKMLDEGQTTKRISIKCSTNGKVVKTINSVLKEMRGRHELLHCPNCDGLSKYNESKKSWKCLSCSKVFASKDGISESTKIETVCPKCPDSDLLVTENLDLECSTCNCKFTFNDQGFLIESKKQKSNKSINENLGGDGATDKEDFDFASCPECGGHTIDSGDIMKCTACDATFDKEEMESDDDMSMDDAPEMEEMDDEDSMDMDDEDDFDYGESKLPISVVYPLNESKNHHKYAIYKSAKIKIYEADEDMLIKPKDDDDEMEESDVDVEIDGDDEEGNPDYTNPPTGPRMNKQQGAVKREEMELDDLDSIGGDEDEETLDGELSDIEGDELESMDEDPLSMDVDDTAMDDLDMDMESYESDDMPDDDLDRGIEDSEDDLSMDDESDDLSLSMSDSEDDMDFSIGADSELDDPTEESEDELDLELDADPQNEAKEIKLIPASPDAFESEDAEDDVSMLDDPEDESDEDPELENCKESLCDKAKLRENSLSHLTILETNSLSSEAARTFSFSPLEEVSARQSATQGWYKCKTKNGSIFNGRYHEGMVYAFAGNYVLEFHESQIAKKKKIKPSKTDVKNYSSLIEFSASTVRAAGKIGKALKYVGKGVKRIGKAGKVAATSAGDKSINFLKTDQGAMTLGGAIGGASAAVVHNRRTAAANKANASSSPDKSSSGSGDSQSASERGYYYRTDDSGKKIKVRYKKPE